MRAEINLITIWANDVEVMKTFYNEVLGFEVAAEHGDYVEFKNHGVRFAICSRKVMMPFSKIYEERSKGQAFELAFPCDTPEDVDHSFVTLTRKGATPIHAPEDMPWGQRTALFADPEGNIHEIFSSL